LLLQASYAWAKSIDDGSGTANFSQPNNNGAYQSQFPYLFRFLDRAVSNFDVPHRVSLVFQYKTRGNRWIRDLQVSPIFFAQSGLPLNISQTKEHPTAQSQRPIVSGASGDVKLPGTYPNGQGIQHLMPASSADFPLIPSGPIVYYGATRSLIQPSEPIGNLGRNTVRAPSSYTLNTSISRGFALREHLNLQLRLAAFNALKHANLGTPATSLTVATSGTRAMFNSPMFGLITTAGQARLLQLGARIDF
jgi:hypothetical protein